MTVPSETNRSGPYNGNGVTTVFNYGFRIVDEDHLRVILTSIVGVETVLVVDADYSVADVGEPAGGQITLMVAPETGETITILRSVPLTQETDLENQGAYYAETVEDRFDLTVMQIQQVAEELDRAIRVPASTDPNTDLQLPAPEANKLIGWNETETGLQNFDAATLASIIAYGTANADVFTGDGVQTVFMLSANPGALNNLDVAIGGVTQLPGVDYNWVSGTTLTFTTAPANGVIILARYMQALAQGESDAASSRFVQAGTGATIRTMQDKARDEFSVKDFGALGIGAGNDTAAILAADAAAALAGKGLYFPEGRYPVTKNAIFLSGASWRGAGGDKSVICATSETFTNLSGLVSCHNRSDFSVSDLGFDLTDGTFPIGVGNPGNIYWALSILGGSNWSVHNCSFFGIGDQRQGLAVDASTWFSVTENYFENLSPSEKYSQACNMSASSGIPSFYTFSGNRMLGCGLFSNGAYGTITGNVAREVGFGAGIAVGPSPGCVGHNISNNICLNGTGTDINAVNINGIECWSGFSVISDNLCMGNAGHGIAHGGYGSKLTGNMLVNNGQVGGDGINVNSITISGVDYYAGQCVISDNTMMDTQGSPTQGYGYAEGNAGGPAIVGTHVINNKVSGYLTAPYLIISSTLNGFVGPSLYGSAASAPGSIGTGGYYDDVIFVNGAAPGDMVYFGYTVDTDGFMMVGNVDVANNVTVRIHNVSGAPKVFPSGTLNVRVEKPRNYTGSF